MSNLLNRQQQLALYVKKNLEKGYTPDTLLFALLSQGYSRTSVEKALEEAQKQIASKVPKIKEKPHIIHEIVEPKILEKKSFLKRLFG